MSTDPAAAVSDSPVESAHVDSGESAVGGLELTFPGTWWQIALADPEAARESVRRLVVHSIGRADQHAPIRAEMRRRLDTAIAEAREANARRFAIAIEIVPDIPIPAFLGIFDVGTDLTSASTADAKDVMDVFASGFGAKEFERFAVGRSDVARRVRYRVIPAEDGVPEVTNLVVEFWLTVPSQKQVVLLAFTSPAAELVEPLLNLFGAVVASASWPPAAHG